MLENKHKNYFFRMQLSDMKAAESCRPLLALEASHMAICTLGKPSVKRLNTIPLLNDTLRRSIENMALNVKENVIVRIKNICCHTT